MTPRLGLRVLAVALPLALLAPAAAHAEKVVVDDAVGDAKSLNLAAELLGADADGPRFFDAPTESANDVTRTTIALGAKRLTITVRVRDLVLSEEHTLEATVFTPTGRWALRAGVAGDGEGSADLYPIRVLASDDVVRMRPCRSARARYDLEADLVSVSMASACIDSPRWVQMELLMTRLEVTPGHDGSVSLAAFGDDAFSPTLSMRSGARSPKVRRG